MKYIKLFEKLLKEEKFIAGGLLDFDDLSKAGRYIELELDLKHNHQYFNFYWDYIGPQTVFSSPQTLNYQKEFGYYFVFKNDADTRSIINFCKKNNVEYYTKKSKSFLGSIEYVCVLSKYMVLNFSQLFDNIKNYNL